MEMISGLGPFDLTGGPFLALYGGLLAIAIVAGAVIPHWLRPEGRGAGESNPDLLAYLSGGRVRLVESLVAGLLSAGALVMEGRNRFRVMDRAGGARPAESAILALPSPAAWSAIAGAARAPARAIEARLVRSGLWMDPATVMQLRFWQTTPYLLLLLFGAIKWDIGVARDRPVGFLTGLMVATAFLAIARFFTLDRRTRSGIAAVRNARADADRLRRAPLAGETELAVALFGTTVLAGSAWSDFHRMRTAGSGDGGVTSDGGSSDGGGSGCGGGGCGGCGS